jgi:hypothetical protein
MDQCKPKGRKSNQLSIIFRGQLIGIMHSNPLRHFATLLVPELAFVVK